MESQEKLYMANSRMKQIMRIPLWRLKVRSKQEKVVDGGLNLWYKRCEKPYGALGCEEHKKKR